MVGRARTSSEMSVGIIELPELGMASADLDAEVDRADLVCVHPEVDSGRVVGAAKPVLDFRGVTRGIEASNVVRL